MHPRVPLALLGLLMACGSPEASDAGPLDGAAGDAAAAVDAGLDAGSAWDAAADAGPPLEDAGLVRREGFVEASGEVANPDRGLYAWDWDTSVDLVLVKVDLGAFCDGAPLTADLLDALRARLGGHRAAGRKVILRFLYADGGELNPCGLADASSVSVIEAHVGQLAPLLAEHVDVLAFVEAGLLGMWGEWNGEHAPAGTSLVADPDVRRRVVEALLAAVPAPRAVLLRRPRFRQELEGVLEPAALARLGHHNDCLFASADDYGTYDGSRTVEEWKEYVASTIAPIAPIGGETCADTLPYTACTNALPELERLGYTYLHQNYRAEVIDRWRAEGCFDEIARRLGYRVVLRAVEAPPERAPGEALPVVIELTNEGFAAPSTSRRPVLVLRGAGVEDVLETTPTDWADSRAWGPGIRQRLALSAALPAGLAPGTYELRLRLLDDRSDAPAYALLFANDAAVRDDARRENVLGELIVR